MTWFEISELQKRGHIIGNHTLNHTELNNLSFESAFDEVKSGKDELENKLGFKCKYFAIPFGTPDFFDQIGIKAALSNHEIIFTSSYDYGNYFYQNQRNILSRRHFEGSWEISHMKYFLSTPRKFH
jgi:peptidoglycan/xylan/chitin deacetylase (PgdA/CDA1 family)